MGKRLKKEQEIHQESSHKTFWFWAKKTCRLCWAVLDRVQKEC